MVYEFHSAPFSERYSSYNLVSFTRRSIHQCQTNMDDVVEAKSFWEMVLHYGLFLGGIFQLICILAIVVVPSEKSGHEEDTVLDKEGKNRKPHAKATSAGQSTATRLRERKKKR